MAPVSNISKEGQMGVLESEVSAKFLAISHSTVSLNKSQLIFFSSILYSPVARGSTATML